MTPNHLFDMSAAWQQATLQAQMHRERKRVLDL